MGDEDSLRLLGREVPVRHPGPLPPEANPHPGLIREGAESIQRDPQVIGEVAERYPHAKEPTMTFRAFPLAHCWGDYASWLTARGKPIPFPSQGIVIASDGVPLCGALLYPTVGPYVFVEHAATNPKAPLRARHGAFSALLEAIREAGRASNQTPICLVQPSAGMKRLLMKAGYEVSPTLQWFPR